MNADDVSGGRFCRTLRQTWHTELLKLGGTMFIDVYGDAFKLLDHFIYYATGIHSHRLAEAMWYDTEGFQRRAKHLEKLFNSAKASDSNCHIRCPHCGRVV